MRYVLSLTDDQDSQHERSHALDASPEAEEAAHNTVKLASLCDYSYFEEEQVDKDFMVDEAKKNASYELRQNSRKRNNRAEDPASTKKFVCVKCGKRFQSQKAMCGHMACHSNKDKIFNNLAAHRSKKNSSRFDQKLVMDIHTDKETNVAVAAGGGSGPILRRSSKRVKYKNNNNLGYNAGSKSNGGPSVCVAEDELEEVAECLMMLSRDSSKPGVLNSVEDSPELSAKMEDMSRRDIIQSLNSPEVWDTFFGSKQLKLKHECLVSSKGFMSGQAHGRHKKIYLTGCSDEFKPIKEQVPLEDSSSQAHSYIDLNQPAPLEDHEFMPW
ncbi:unnamed protein product [Rhodiola kirilowii]